MSFRRFIFVIAPIALVGCVRTHPLVLGADHPANPSASTAPDEVASVEILSGYQAASAFVAPMARSTAPDDVAGNGASSPNVQLAHEGHDDAHAVGVVNSVNAAQHKINLTHEPIPSIGWPSMTMDFDVAPSVDLAKFKKGNRVNFTMEKGKSGMYEIQAIQPAAAK